MRFKVQHIVLFISFFICVLLYTSIYHSYHLKKEIGLKINFIVAKKDVRINGFCTLYDENKNEFPIKSYAFYESLVYEGDSLVKKENSKLLLVYRKRNWRDYGEDDSYFIAEKINLD